MRKGLVTSVNEGGHDVPQASPEPCTQTNGKLFNWTGFQSACYLSQREKEDNVSIFRKPPPRTPSQVLTGTPVRGSSPTSPTHI